LNLTRWTVRRRTGWRSWWRDSWRSSVAVHRRSVHSTDDTRRLYIIWTLNATH